MIAIYPDTLSPLVVDTIRVIDQQAYIELLEKTNQQLSYWWTPWSVMLGVLTVLIGGGAIMASALFFRQSRDHRTLVQEVIERQLQVLNDFVAEKNDLIDLRLTEVRQEINSATGEHRKELEAEYQALKDRLAARPAFENRMFRIAPGYSTSASTPTRRSPQPLDQAVFQGGGRCPSCGTHWDIDEPPRSGDHLVCPRCMAEFPLVTKAR
jgi:hypothetical protein